MLGYTRVSAMVVALGDLPLENDTK
jgi:hypothetical protein